MFFKFILNSLIPCFLYIFMLCYQQKIGKEVQCMEIEKLKSEIIKKIEENYNRIKDKKMDELTSEEQEIIVWLNKIMLLSK